MNTHPATVMAPELEGACWFKSSYSNNGGACVEAADLTQTAYHGIAVRDSKDPNGPALLFSPEAFAAFVTDAREGNYDI